MTDEFVDVAKYVIPKGKYKGKLLTAPNSQELSQIESSKTKGRTADFCRDYAALTRKYADVVTRENSNLGNQSLDAQPLQIVPYQRKSKPEEKPVVNVKKPEEGCSLADLVSEAGKTFFSLFDFGFKISVFALLKYTLLAFVCCLIYPPLARLPGKVSGIIVNSLFSRFKAVGAEFTSAFRD